MQLLLWLGGVVGCLENWRVMLISTQVVVDVEVGVGLGNMATP